MDEPFAKGNDKRFFIRMDIDTDAYFQFQGKSEKYLCNCSDLSAAGMSLTTELEVLAGTIIRVLVPSHVDGFDDLNATAEVMCCQQDDSGLYKLGIKVIETE